ncbi:hypothetical protein MO973_37195 [Paenibacillus sp. TRM 82003]|uniref:hypothetical protein n=1 Tax=Kineococcus sp. TRM81007 TaxID=2925831 RepID=UPI001F5A5C48|nr:hypothetical protein [Kineococcus sp. TRM81007]MCI2239850.1 hypothetical protein [Kineococcus sp. TRM81007]MCI3925846.1 hypothetical protein [Paenibacillus sp. TRM 82003]
MRWLSTAIGGTALVGGAVSWALAATAMSAVHAAEARALGPGHTAQVPGEDELALIAHDVRLAAVAAMWCALPLLPARPAHRAAGRAAGRATWRGAPPVPVASWLGAGAAVVLANAVLGRAVDGRSPALAAVLVLAAVGAGAAVGAAAGTAISRGWRTGRPAPPAGGARWWWLAGAGSLAAGTACAVAVQDLGGERYATFTPGDLSTADALVTLTLLLVSGACAGALRPAAAPPAGAGSGPAPRAVGAPTRAVLVVLPTALAVVLLLDPAGFVPGPRDLSRAVGPALVAALAPFLLAAGPGLRAPSRRRVLTTALVLTGAAAVSTAALPLLVPVVVVGGMLGLALTAPAGAYVNYDGLPTTGAGGLLALGALGVLLVLTGEHGARSTPAVERSPA